MVMVCKIHTDTETWAANIQCQGGLGGKNKGCEGEGNELVVYGPNSNAMRFENSKYDSPHASWWHVTVN